MSGRDQFDTDEDYKKQLIKELIYIAEELGWNVCIPDVEEDEMVPGLILGEPEYIEEVMDALEDEGFEA